MVTTPLTASTTYVRDIPKADSSNAVILVHQDKLMVLQLLMSQS